MLCNAKLQAWWKKLVPTNQISTPLIDLTAAGANTNPIWRAWKQCIIVYRSLSQRRDNQHDLLGNAVTPSTLNISGTGNGITDKAKALIYNTAQIGTIDYASGFATINEPTLRVTYLLQPSTRHQAELKLPIPQVRPLTSTVSQAAIP